MPTAPTPPELEEEVFQRLPGVRAVYLPPYPPSFFVKVAKAVHAGNGLVAVDVESSSPVMGEDLERVMQRVKAMEYDCKTGSKQPEPAYLLNLQARIAAVQRRLGNG